MRQIIFDNRGPLNLRKFFSAKIYFKSMVF